METSYRKRLLEVASSFVTVLTLVLFYSFAEAKQFAIAPAVAPVEIADKLADKIYNTPELNFPENKKNIYDNLNLLELGLSRKVFELALRGMEKLVRTNHISNRILSIVDLSQPSENKRLYVIDLDNQQLLFNSLVAHGRRSGKEMAAAFSNKMKSLKSSLGFYITGESYYGSNGYSLKLIGMENGINSNALRRAIVVHGADYVSEKFIDSQGYIGRSQGCPAVPAEISQPLIEQIKDGTCMFIYHPTISYLKKSSLLR